MSKLDDELGKLCDEFGWSYSGDPLVTVRSLFQKNQDAENLLTAQRRKQDQWIQDLLNIVSQAPGEHAADPFNTVKRLVEESRARLKTKVAEEEKLELEVKPLLRANFDKLSRAEVSAIGHAVIAELQSRCSES